MSNEHVRVTASYEFDFARPAADAMAAPFQTAPGRNFLEESKTQGRSSKNDVFNTTPLSTVG